MNVYIWVSEYVCDLGGGPWVSGLQSPQLVNEEGRSNDLWFPVDADTLSYLLGKWGGEVGSVFLLLFCKFTTGLSPSLLPNAVHSFQLTGCPPVAPTLYSSHPQKPRPSPLS